MTDKKKQPRKRPSKATKPKEMDSPAQEAAATDAPASETPVVSEARPVDPYEGKLYSISTWKGLPNYECLFCAYATVNHEAAFEHAADAHAPDPEQIVNTGRVDRSGVPRTRAAQPEMEE